MRRIIFWGFIFALFTAFVFGAELERYSGQSEDDGQEASAGYVNTSYDYIELRVDLGRWGGAYRFPNVTIPKGATIDSAYVSLICFVSTFRYPRDSIACEDVDSATVLSPGGGSYDISSRWSRRTDAAVLWTDTVRCSGMTRDSTPDLSSLVQEIVNRPNWKSGNAIIFLFKCTIVGADSSYYETYSWDIADHTYGAILYVNYTPGGAPNDPPVVSDIRDSTIAEGESFDPIDLDDYVTDPDDHDSVMIWTHWGEVELLVDITDRVVTITVPDSEWNGFETIWFKACDPGGLCDSNEATFTVTAFNDTPVVSNIPDQTIAENESFASINLDDYVEDPDNPDGDMIWAHWGKVELLVDVTDRVVTITVPDPGWNGFETIWFKACDPGGLCDSNEATFTVLGSDFVDEDSLLLRSENFLLNQNSPNPFNLRTSISYSLPMAGRIKLTIYDLLGRRVRTLVDTYQAPGHKSLDWDATDDEGDAVASGIYFYRLEVESVTGMGHMLHTTETKKILLLK